LPKTQGKVFWLCRDSSHVFKQEYNVYATKEQALKGKESSGSSGIYWGGCLITMCPRDFKKITGIVMKPGEGPVKVRLVRV